MDWESFPIPPNPRPTSSIYSDDLPIMTTLLKEVSEETLIQEHRMIASYISENKRLEEELVLYRKAWNGTIKLANEAIQAITSFERIIFRVNTKVARAERDWLAFWGIYKESNGSHPSWL